jgi:phage baseplate assembly protein W
MVEIHYPYQFDHRGRTAQSDQLAHIRQLIEQVLFTAAGERVNRPDFGCGIMQLIFAPNSDELAATAKMLVHAALQQTLSDKITLNDVAVANDEATLRISIDYTVRRTQQQDHLVLAHRL